MRLIVAVALLLALAGCTAQQGVPTPSAKPVSSAPHVFSGTGPSQNTVTVPAGAKSAEISVTCASNDGAFLSITVGDQDQPRGGACSSTVRFHVAVKGSIAVGADLSGGTGRYVVQLRFSADPFTSDAGVATQCTAASGAFSDIASAQNGYPNGPLDLAGWRQLMASAAQKLQAVDTSGAIGTQLGALTAWYGRSDLTPAELTGVDANEAFEIVNNICLDNGTPLAILSQYGG